MNPQSFELADAEIWAATWEKLDPVAGFTSAEADAFHDGCGIFASVASATAATHKSGT